ncbi:MAG: peptide chain release factor 1 [archaeon]|nr:peptide chain release factor 1 [archaeon]
MSRSNSKDDTYQRFLLKKEIKYLRTKKGYHTELITLMIPPERKISDVTNYLKNEINESSNIKSKLTKKNVIDSITALLQKLKNIKKTPPNGLFMFSGAIPQGNTAGTEKNELYIVEPLERISHFKYHCSSEFYLEPLEDQLSEKETYGIIVIDQKEVAMGWVRGSHVEVVKTSSSGVAGKHRAGGQSQRRFERLHEEHVAYFLNRSSEIANEIYVSMEIDGILEGIFVGGAGHTKNKFAEHEGLDYRLRKKILDPVDIGVSGSEGIRAVLIKVQDKIANVRYIKEKKVMQKFLYNLSNDTGLVAYGEKEVRDALERSAIDKLLLSESLNLERITATCEKCGNIAYKTVKNESEKKKFIGNIKNDSCSECNSNLFSITDVQSVLEEFGEYSQTVGTDIEIISSETEEGETLTSTFGGIAAILRYRLN